MNRRNFLGVLGAVAFVAGAPVASEDAGKVLGGVYLDHRLVGACEVLDVRHQPDLGTPYRPGALVFEGRWRERARYPRHGDVLEKPLKALWVSHRGSSYCVTFWRSLYGDLGDRRFHFMSLWSDAHSESPLGLVERLHPAEDT